MRAAALVVALGAGTAWAQELPFSPERKLGLPLIAAIAARYGVRLVEDRAVILFDAVGFSLLTPLQQVVQLNSLSCSVNAAYAKLLDDAKRREALGAAAGIRAARFTWEASAAAHLASYAQAVQEK